MLFKRLMSGFLAVVMLMQLAGCGTILHPERKGQRAGNLDPSIVILDAVGLLFFIVPGVIAFAIDFNNGSIYLPGGKRADAASNDTDVRMVYLGERIHDRAAVVKAINDATGQTIAPSQINMQAQGSETVALLQ